MGERPAEDRGSGLRPTAGDPTAEESRAWHELIAARDDRDAVEPRAGTMPKHRDAPGAGGAMERPAPGHETGQAGRLWQIFGPILEADDERPFVVAQLGQSLDGRIATESGHSHYIGCCGALDHLHRLRALVDAVVVGNGTVLSDDPQLTVRRCAGRNPARVVIDVSGRIGPGARCLAADGAPVFVVRGPDGGPRIGAEEIRLPATGGHVSPAAIVAALGALGMRRILVEGGSSTLSAFLAAEAVDRLHVAVAPLIIGSGMPGVRLPPVATVGEALRPPTAVHALAGGDVLFDCDLAAVRRRPAECDDDATDFLPPARAGAALGDGALRAGGHSARPRHGRRGTWAAAEHPV